MPTTHKNRSSAFVIGASEKLWFATFRANSMHRLEVCIHAVLCTFITYKMIFSVDFCVFLLRKFRWRLELVTTLLFYSKYPAIFNESINHTCVVTYLHWPYWHITKISIVSNCLWHHCLNNQNIPVGKFYKTFLSSTTPLHNNNLQLILHLCNHFYYYWRHRIHKSNWWTHENLFLEMSQER